MSKKYRFGSDDKSSSPLDKAARFDPDSAIQDAQARIDAEDTVIHWYRRPFFITALVSVFAVGTVAGYYMLDQYNIRQTVESCLFHLKKLDTGDQTVEECTVAAREGNKYAVAGLAGIYVARDRKAQAYPYLKQCAQENNYRCEYYLSGIYLEGMNGLIQPDINKYLYWLDRAASHGSMQANFTLYQLYTSGSGDLKLKKNPDRADEYLQNAADLNHPVALFKMSENYREGKAGYETDYRKSLEYLKKSADQGYPEALGRYGHYLLQNNNLQEAGTYLEKGAAAGDPLSSTLLAGLYQNGSFNISDNDLPLQDKIGTLYITGAEAGNEDAITSLIDLYHDTEDSFSHNHWLKIALDRNIPRAFSQMGRALEEGYIIQEPDMPVDNEGLIVHKVLKEQPILETAVQYYRRGISRQDPASYRRLLEIFADPRFNGKLDKFRFKLAEEYAELDPQNGLEVLADCYFSGIGVSRNEDKSTELLVKKITDYGDVTLASALTRQYLTGKGSKYNFKKNVKKACYFADLLLETGEEGVKVYLKLADELRLDKKSEHEVISDFLLGISSRTREMLQDNLEYQYEILSLGSRKKNLKPQEEELVRKSAEILVNRGYMKAVMLYASLAEKGKVPFSAPDHKKATELYKLAVSQEGPEAGQACGALAVIYGEKLDKKDRDFKQSLQYARAAVDRRYDPALKFLLTHFVYDTQNKNRDLLLPEEKYYYLKLAEMLEIIDRQGKGILTKIQGQLDEQQRIQSDQMVYEEMAARKASQVK
ncbi:MAG: hypothetical protein ACI4VX_02100 [Succinivibrionaceae bacterium]